MKELEKEYRKAFLKAVDSDLSDAVKEMKARWEKEDEEARIRLEKWKEQKRKRELRIQREKEEEAARYKNLPLVADKIQKAGGFIQCDIVGGDKQRDCAKKRVGFRIRR